MNLTTDVRDTAAIVAISGRLTAAGAPRLRTAVNELLATGVNRIVVDLGQTDFVDSSGLGALIGGLKNTRLKGGDLRIAAVPESVQTVLKLTNLDRVLRSHATAEEAFDE